MAPRISSRVCSLLPPCPAWTARAHGNTDRHRSMVLESSAYTVWAKSTPRGSSAYRRRAVPLNVCAKSAWIRQSRRSLASDRTRGVSGTRVSVTVDLGGRRLLQHTTYHTTLTPHHSQTH